MENVGKHCKMTCNVHVMSTFLLLITARKRSCGKVMFSEMFVCPRGEVMVLSGGGSMKGRVCNEGDGVLWRGQAAMKGVL